MTSSLRLQELNHLYASLSPEERDELLQCLLIAASIDGETVLQRLEECQLELAGGSSLKGCPSDSELSSVATKLGGRTSPPSVRTWGAFLFTRLSPLRRYSSTVRLLV